MDSMVERCGLAIQAAWDSGDHPAVNLPPIEFTKAEREYLARAAISAMMEPTKEMVEAGITAAEEVEDYSTDTNETYRCDTPSDMPKPVWQAMIKAALTGTDGRQRHEG